jgi:6-pyruvoyltetrahydropterin/6-carboxytetrahydropterin synthase
MPGRKGPEGELHTHDYTVEVCVQRSELDEGGMVCDLDVLQECVAEIGAKVEGARLDEVLKSPRGVTVETLAHWFAAEVAARLGDDGGAAIAVRAWESPVAWGGYRRSSSV